MKRTQLGGRSRSSFSWPLVIVVVLSVGVLVQCSDDTEQDFLDAALPDAGRADLQPPDANVPDMARSDMAVPDQLVPDKMVPDQQVPDQAVPDKMVSDKMVADQAVPDMKPSAPGTWVTIKAGTFQMGSPDGTGTQPKELCRSSDETQHQVTLTHKFEIQTTEVTQGQFTSLMGYSPSYFPSCGGTCPVEQVNWHEAAAYANALSAKAGKANCYACTGSGTSVTCSEATAYAGAKVYTCPGYRLPTEAEWEYAYRAGTTTAFYNGGITNCYGADSNANKIGWYSINSSSKTHPAGQKIPNAWGLSDMAGNVWEWCHDWYGTYPTTSVTDPLGTSGSYRVLRGGSWGCYPSYMRAAARYSFTPTSRYGNLGFRCARTKN